MDVPADSRGAKTDALITITGIGDHAPGIRDRGAGGPFMITAPAIMIIGRPPNTATFRLGARSANRD